MSKARITYRFDEPGRHGEKRSPYPIIPLSKEEFSVVEDDRHAASTPTPIRMAPEGRLYDTQPLNQFTTDFGAWKSPFEVETEEVERLIRQSSSPMPPPSSPPVEPRNGRAAAEDTGLQPDIKQSDWPRARGHDNDGGPRQPPEDRWGPIVEEELYEDRRMPHAGASQPVYGGMYGRHYRPPWLKMIASVSGAVATGVLIGFFVLSMFGGEGAPPHSGGGAVNPPPSAGGAAVSGQAQTPDGASVPVAAVRLDAQSYTLLQNGVFTTRQGADAAAAELRKRGLAAHVLETDKYYVYAGLSPSHDDALALSNVLKEQRMELFLKTVTLPAASAVQWSGGSAAAADTFVAQSRVLVRTIGEFSASRLKDAKPAAIDDQTLQAIHTSHQAWTGAVSTFGNGLPEQHKPAFQQWTTGINSAVAAIDEYKRNPSSALLWGAQSSLMQSLFAEQALLAAIKVE